MKEKEKKNTSYLPIFFGNTSVQQYKIQGRAEDQLPFGDNQFINKMDIQHQQQLQQQQQQHQLVAAAVENDTNSQNNSFYSNSNNSTPFIESPNQHQFVVNDQQPSNIYAANSNSSSQQVTPIVTNATAVSVSSATNMSPTNHISPITPQSIEQAMNNAAANSMTSSPSLITMVNFTSNGVILSHILTV